MTVAVICHNNEATVRESIESVLHQDFHDIEIIVVDDCSTDGSVEVITALQYRDSRITLLSTAENSGSAGHPRNLAIDKAQGRYITFLDGDDVLAPNACTVLYANAVEHRVDIVTAQMERKYIATGESILWNEWLFSKARTLDSVLEDPQLVYDSTTTNKTYSMDFLRRCGLRFPEGRYFEDNEFSQRAFAHAQGIRIIPDSVYYWHVYSVAERSTVTSNWKDVGAYSDRMEAFFRGYEEYGQQGMVSLQESLVLKTLSLDVWLFIDKAFKAKDYVTMIRLWNEMQPVLILARGELLNKLSLRHRAKIAALKEGDLKAYHAANTLTSGNNRVEGFISGDLWLPRNWAPERVVGTSLEPYLKLNGDEFGLRGSDRGVWVHTVTKVDAGRGCLYFEGTTRDCFGYFDGQREVRAVASLRMEGGDIRQVIPVLCKCTKPRLTAWSFVIDDYLEDSLLRNQHWWLELSFIQDERSISAEIQAPRGFEATTFTPRKNGLNVVLLDRFALKTKKARVLYVRRHARRLPLGIPSRVLSTCSRLKSRMIHIAEDKITKERLLRLIAQLGALFPARDELAVVNEQHLEEMRAKLSSAGDDAIKEIFCVVDDLESAGITPTHMVKAGSYAHAWLSARARTNM